MYLVDTRVCHHTRLAYSLAICDLPPWSELPEGRAGRVCHATLAPPHAMVLVSSPRRRVLQVTEVGLGFEPMSLTLTPSGSGPHRLPPSRGPPPACPLGAAARVRT